MLHELLKQVDVTLRPTLPQDSPAPMPEAGEWRRWASEVTGRLAPLLPNQNREEKDGLAALSWRGEPVARVGCGPDGRLYLTRVELSAWQGIDLPRQWDDPERERDGGPNAQLADFAGRVREALFEWGDCLRYLG